MVFSQVTIYRECADSGTVYTENGLHRPYQITNLTGTTIQTFIDVHPRKSEQYSRMVVPLQYKPIGTGQPRFLKVTEKSFDDYGTEVLATIYGWVDSVKTLTEPDTESGSNVQLDSNLINTEVRWHIDWWLTRQEYSGTRAKYKGGRLKRGPASYARPDPSAPRLWTTDSVTQIGNATDRWCIVQYVHTDNGSTRIKTLFWPVGGSIDIGGTTYQGMNLDGIYSGAVEEVFGLDTDSVIGAWISPVPPLKTANLTPVPSTIGLWYAYDELMTFPDHFDLTLTAAVTSDSAKYVIVDPYGAVMATAPWGLTFDTVRVAVDIGAAGAGLLLKFLDSTDTADAGEGRETVIPLITVPITSNNWQSYNISGQRAYDLETARIQNEQQLVNGIAGAATAAATGAVMGSIVPGVGTLAGAAVGLGSSLISTGINFGTGSMYQGQTQAAVDRLMSNQANNLAFGAGGASWASSVSPGYWKLVKMTRDSVSLAELTAEQSELGYLTDTQVADCSTLIAGKGGLRIEGLEVYGVAPEGARYISNMFARGVHID